MSVKGGGFERIVTDGGETRILNLMESDPADVRLMAGPRSRIPLAEIMDFDDRPDFLAIKDQDGKGACVGHGSARAAEYALAMRGGPNVPLSAWYSYGMLARGVDRGANILDSLKMMSDVGIAPEALVRYGDYSGRYSPEATTAAARYKIEIGAALGRDWEAIVTAVALRRPVVLAVCVTNDWGARGNLDASGCPPVGTGPCNHCVVAYGEIKTAPNGGKLLGTDNSWGTKWGLNGRYYTSRDHVERCSWFEAFEIRAMIRDPLDDVPPVS